MISRIREQIGAAGLVVAIIALIAALAGGAAFAASGGLSGKQKKEVKAIAKSFQGTGPAGAPGKDGAQGAAGKDGAQGPEGKQGSQGVQGVPGTPGTPGTPGKEGSPWTAGGILPSEKTETGVWGGGGSGGLVTIPISFTLPVEPPPTLVYVEPEETKVAEGCPGIAASGVPLADPGKLCVYAGLNLNSVLLNPPSVTIQEESGIKSTPAGVGPAGTNIFFICGTEEFPPCRMNGAWAVTAE